MLYASVLIKHLRNLNILLENSILDSIRIILKLIWCVFAIWSRTNTVNLWCFLNNSWQILYKLFKNMLVHCSRGLHLIPHEFSYKWYYFYEKYWLHQLTQTCFWFVSWCNQYFSSVLLLQKKLLLEIKHDGPLNLCFLSSSMKKRQEKELGAFYC